MRFYGIYQDGRLWVRTKQGNLIALELLARTYPSCSFDIYTKKGDRFFE